MNTSPKDSAMDQSNPMPTPNQDEILRQSNAILELLYANLSPADQEQFESLVIRGLDNAFENPQARRQLRQVLTRQIQAENANRLQTLPEGMEKNQPTDTV